MGGYNTEYMYYMYLLNIPQYFKKQKKLLLENFTYRLIPDEHIISIDLSEFALFFLMILIGMSTIGARSLV